MQPTRTIASRRLAAILALACLAGCGYSLRTQYDTKNIQTVYVGVFQSKTFRRDLNIELSNMIQNEIRLRTPYRVVGSPEGADAVLDGTITYVDKNVQVENPNNLPRHLLSSIQATVTFVDNRSKTSTTKKSQPVTVTEMSPFYGEIGETASLGYEKTLQKMAQDIVSMMEVPWGKEYRDDIDAAPFDPDTAPIDAPRRRPAANVGARRPTEADGARR